MDVYFLFVCLFVFVFFFIVNRIDSVVLGYWERAHSNGN